MLALIACPHPSWSINVSKNDQIYIDTITTCTESGYEAYDTCSRCSYTTYAEIPAKGHSYGEWTVDREPTADEEGEMSRKCSSCGDVEKQSIPKLVKSNTGLFVTIGVISGVGTVSLASLLVFLIRRKRM